MKTNGEFDNPDELDNEYSWLSDKFKPNITIRTITKNDKNAIIQIDFIRSKELDEYPLCDTKELDKYLTEKNGNTICLVALAPDGKTVVGYLIYNVNKKSMSILRWAVHPEWSGFGRGKALIQKMLKTVNEQQVKVTAIFTEKAMTAHEVLFSLGFNLQLVGDKWNAIWTKQKG